MSWLWRDAARLRLERTLFASRFAVIIPPILTTLPINVSMYLASTLFSASTLALEAAVAPILAFISSSARCKLRMSATTSSRCVLLPSSLSVPAIEPRCCKAPCSSSTQG
eukprot:scaffold64867_cov35-Tisochrysis_lutea.AAC.1